MAMLMPHILRTSREPVLLGRLDLAHIIARLRDLVLAGASSMLLCPLPTMPTRHPRAGHAPNVYLSK